MQSDGDISMELKLIQDEDDDQLIPTVTTAVKEKGILVADQQLVIVESAQFDYGKKEICPSLSAVDEVSIYIFVEVQKIWYHKTKILFLI